MNRRRFTMTQPEPHFVLPRSPVPPPAPEAFYACPMGPMPAGMALMIHHVYQLAWAEAQAVVRPSLPERDLAAAPN